MAIHGIMSNRKGGVLDEKGTGRVVIHSVNVDIEFFFNYYFFNNYFWLLSYLETTERQLYACYFILK